MVCVGGGGDGEGEREREGDVKVHTTKAARTKINQTHPSNHQASTVRKDASPSIYHLYIVAVAELVFPLCNACCGSTEKKHI